MKWEYYNLCRFPWFPYWDTPLNSEKMEAPKIRTIFGCKRGIDMRGLLFQGYMEQNIYHFQVSIWTDVKPYRTISKPLTFWLAVCFRKPWLSYLWPTNCQTSQKKSVNQGEVSVKTNQPRFILCFSNQPSFASKAVKGSDTKVYLTEMLPGKWTMKMSICIYIYYMFKRNVYIYNR